METFNEADFAVGREVLINGATFLIYGCDEFTRDYYTQARGRRRTAATAPPPTGPAPPPTAGRPAGRANTMRLRAVARRSLEPCLLPPPVARRVLSAIARARLWQVYGVTFEDIPVQFDEQIERPQMLIPPHVAPGAEEDSLGSFLYLIPKVPKKNFRRMMENDRKILRFMARLDTDTPEDQGRIFVIKYYLSDDTVAVFEPPQKNSGIVGGKFLERCRVKKPNSH
eukprot:2587330-Prymnesium_polylepis.1